MAIRWSIKRLTTWKSKVCEIQHPWGGWKVYREKERIIRLGKVRKKEKEIEIEMVYPRGLNERDNGFLVIKR